MNKKFLLLIIISFCFIFFNFTQLSAKRFLFNEDNNEIIVKFKNGIFETLRLSNDFKFEEALKFYNQNNLIEYAELNYKYRTAIIPSDTYFQEQWHTKIIKADKAWDIIRENPDIIIAIIDSGVQVNHPDLKDNIWINTKEIPNNKVDDDKNGFIDDIYGWDFVNNIADPSPKFNEGFTEEGIQHGTVVAGIAAAVGNNAFGTSGIIWRTKIMSLKALDDAGEGNAFNIIKAIDYAVNNGAKIINLSFIGFGYSKSLYEAIKRAYDAGVIVVAAAGNEKDSEQSDHSLDDIPMYPVCYDGPNGENIVIGVAATDTMDQKTSFSGYGSSCVDLAAPGTGIFSTIVYSPLNFLGTKPFDSYHGGYWSGTSMATPMVAATIALVKGVNPSLSKNQVVDTIIKTSDDINYLNPKYINKLGKGRLNVYSAVLTAKNNLDINKIKLLLTPLTRAKAIISIANETGKEEFSFESYNNFNKGISFVAGDIDGDHSEEIIVARASNSEPQIKIFSSSGKLKGQFLAYDKKFQNGVNVAVGDMEGDGIKEIITAPAFNGGPHIKIFSSSGKLKGQFLAYDKKFRGGINMVTGDIDGDNKEEIIIVPASNGGPHVRIFSGHGKIKEEFFAYDKNFKGGINIAFGSLRSGRVIITSLDYGNSPEIKIFNIKGELLSQFFAFNKLFKGGVKISAADLNNDGLSEIIAAAGVGGGPHVRIFDIYFKDLLWSFYAYDSSFLGGVNVATINIKK